jgi:UDPglucose--hexose-1-phosphate uridylyltransferase
LIVTPVVPQTIVEKLAACKRFHDYRGRCLLCDIAAQELEQKSRVVIDSGQFLAFEPYAARTPFETWIVPKTHESHFEDLSQPLCEELAYVLKRTLAKLEKGLRDVSYNYMFYTAPFDTPALPHFHWHVEIVPRLTRQAGFEWGTGFYINPVPPEEAAEYLRSVKL